MRPWRIAVGLAYAMALAIIVIGVRFLVAPEAGAAGYGIAASEGAYLEAKGLRDIATGLVGLVLLAARRYQAGGWAVLALSVIPFGDTVIVLSRGGDPALALAVHGVTGAAMVLVGLGLLLLRRERLAEEGARPLPPKTAAQA